MRNTKTFHISNILFQILIISFFLSIINTQANEEKCTELIDLIYKPYKEITTYISKNMDKLKKKPQSCIDVLIKNGKLEELDHYLIELGKNHIQYREILALSINTMKKQLDEINNRHRFDEKEYQTVLPAFKWAQSLEDVFIEIKYAHRHDSPGCLEIRDLKIDIQNTSVSLIGYCVLGDVPIKIDFAIDTYKGINVTECSHGSGSVGRYQITLRKSEKGFWKKLLADGSPIPANMRVWFEMKEKFENELKEFEDKEDDMDLDKMLEKKNKKGKKKNKKKKNASSNNKDSNSTSTNSSNSKNTDL